MSAAFVVSCIKSIIAVNFICVLLSLLIHSFSLLKHTDNLNSRETLLFFVFDSSCTVSGCSFAYVYHLLVYCLPLRVCSLGLVLVIVLSIWRGWIEIMVCLCLWGSQVDWYSILHLLGLDCFLLICLSHLCVRWVILAWICYSIVHAFRWVYHAGLSFVSIGLSYQKALSLLLIYLVVY